MRCGIERVSSDNGNAGQGRRRGEGCVQCGAGMRVCWRVRVYGYGKEEQTRGGEEGGVGLGPTALWRRSEYDIAAVLFFSFAFLRCDATRLEAN